MKIICPICKGAGWSDTTLELVGTKPTCKSCGGIGTINIASLKSEIERLTAKIDKIRSHLYCAYGAIPESKLWAHEFIGAALDEANNG